MLTAAEPTLSREPLRLDLSEVPTFPTSEESLLSTSVPSERISSTTSSSEKRHSDNSLTTLLMSPSPTELSTLSESPWLKFFWLAHD